ncbi:MAG: hypothetical protein SPF57_05525 [Streptococcus orisratti]|uniref:hypothetical protein n=1 Tax=Streptococcus orisratti TaxID=114652 RepID=UPI002A90C361|nr:hypothetical protein [Streptococcus orisratti]MDY5635785.1 hypothetical protein [Streptococcus orisratti]
MDNIHEELADLSAWDLPIELRRILAKYIDSKVQGRVSSFINLSLFYSNGRYTDFIRAYMYFELMRRRMLADMEKLCKKL